MSEGGPQTLLVQVPAPDSGPPTQVRHLEPGEQITFGRGAPGCAVDVQLDGDDVSRVAGEISAVDDYWLISNLSTDTAYVVENPEGGGEYLTIPPRRIAAPVPFEFSRVTLPGAGTGTAFLVFAPQHGYADADLPGSLDGTATASSFTLDETAKYFLVLVALCEPRLRDSATAALPAASDIVDRLRVLPSCRRLTRAAVNYHIDYLAIHKLRVKEPEPGAGRLEWKREALALTALRFGVVRQEHLALLPARGPVPGGR